MSTKHPSLSYKKIAGDNLRRFISESKCGSQQEFAIQFNATIRTVNRWINEGINSLDIVEEIADFFGVDVLTILSC